MYKKIIALFSLLSVILYGGFSFGGGHNWDEVLAEAKKEGKVNWFQWYLVDAFAEFITDAEQFVLTVSEPGPPSTFAGLIKSHEELKSLSELILADTKELLEGLTSSDTGERRSAALDSFNNNINVFQQKIEEIVAVNTSG